jgi:hypothetical protein
LRGGNQMPLFCFGHRFFRPAEENAVPRFDLGENQALAVFGNQVDFAEARAKIATQNFIPLASKIFFRRRLSGKTEGKI